MYRLKVTDTQVIIGIVLLGVFLRAFYLNQPMRFDESATFLHYVNQDWSQLFNYTAPNNHVLNTLLIKLTTALWGSHPLACLHIWYRVHPARLLCVQKTG